MNITQVRHYRGANYTISRIYVNESYFCDAIEDTDRGLSDFMTDDEITSRKVYARTAIPYGSYEVTIDVVSPKMSQKAIYKPIRGKLPRLLNVKGFDGILVHIGNTERSSAGCIIVGKNDVKGAVSDSTKTFFALYAMMQKARAKGEKIIWSICKK